MSALTNLDVKCVCVPQEPTDVRVNGQAEPMTVTEGTAISVTWSMTESSDYDFIVLPFDIPAEESPANLAEIDAGQYDVRVTAVCIDGNGSATSTASVQLTVEEASEEPLPSPSPTPPEEPRTTTRAPGRTPL